MNIFSKSSETHSLLTQCVLSKYFRSVWQCTVNKRKHPTKLHLSSKPSHSHDIWTAYFVRSGSFKNVANVYFFKLCSSLLLCFISVVFHYSSSLSLRREDQMQFSILIKIVFTHSVDEMSRWYGDICRHGVGFGRLIQKCAQCPKIA